MKTLLILLSIAVTLGFGPVATQAQVGVILEDSAKKKDETKKEEPKKEEPKKEEAKKESAAPAAPATQAKPADTTATTPTSTTPATTTPTATTPATPVATTPATPVATTPAQPAQPTQPTQPAEPEDPTAAGEVVPSRVTLQLMTGCETNSAESVALHIKGVVSVDVESQKGSLIIDYESSKVSPQQIIDKLSREKGCFAKTPSAVVGGTGK